MYNPYGTFRSWLCNAVIANVASSIDPMFTAEMCVIEADRYMNSHDLKWRENEIMSAIERSKTPLASTASLFVLGVARTIHPAAYIDMCLEVTRIFLGAIEQYK